MKYSLLILAAPYSTQSVGTALRFCKAAIASQHQIERVFFYHDGVNCGNLLSSPPSDEVDLPEEWRQLATENNIDLVLCVASALRRGILDSKEATRYDKPSANTQAPFEISGLGQLIDACQQSDRMITFAA